MNVLSLFSGIGGLDLGLERAGMTVVGQVEIDPWCQRVLAKHWPEVPRHDDVRTCADWWLAANVADAEGGRRACGIPPDGQAVAEPAGRDTSTGTSRSAAGTGRPAVDLVCGGFPCQPVSSAGRRLAQEDPRWLWPAFAEVIRRLRPAYALMENVPGLLVRGMGDVLGDLAACGYDAEWDCISASAVGAPHRRDRVWIVAYARDRAKPEWPRPARRQSWQRAPERGIPRGDGQNVAHPNGERARTDTGGSRTPSPARAADGAQRRREPRPDIGSGSPGMADADGAAWPPTRPAGQTVFRPGAVQRPGRRGSGGGDVSHADREPLGWLAVPRPECDHWAVEPAVGRVAHGIPGRVDRLRGLGNAVVPQVAEHIGRLILGAAA